MITDEGKIHIKRYLAGYVANLALSVAWGAGDTAVTATDTSLALETGRGDVVLVDYDFETDRIIYKVQVPDAFVGNVYEIGLYSSTTDTSSGSYGSRALTTFDSITEGWNAGTYTSVNTRVGIDSLNLAPAANGTLTSSISQLNLDLSGYSGSDQFVVGFYNNNTNASTVAVRFKTDEANYYTFSISNPAVGYFTTAFNKSAAVATGTPDWASITSIEVSLSAKAAGPASVDFDAVRIEDRDTLNQDYVLIAREVIAPQAKLDGQSMDIEFALEVTI
jgi:hypothetical protein